MREQLDAAQSTNDTVNAELKRMDADVAALRAEMEAKEAEFAREEASFNDHYNREHQRLLGLWRSVVAFRRECTDMKTRTERDLNGQRSEATRAARSFQSAVYNLSANQRGQDTVVTKQLERERAERSQLEGQLREKSKQVMELQAQLDASTGELQAQLSEARTLGAQLRDQVTQQDRQLTAQRAQLAAHEQSGALLQVESAAGLAAAPGGRAGSVCGSELQIEPEERIEFTSMHEALRRIADEAMSEPDGPEEETCAQMTQRSLHASSPLRAMRGAAASRNASPLRKEPGNDTTFTKVQSALSKRQLQVSELRAKLSAREEHTGARKRSIAELETTRKASEQNLLSAKEERDNHQRAKADAERAQQRLHDDLELAAAERAQLEKARGSLHEQVDVITLEHQKLQAVHAELQRQVAEKDDEKEDVVKDKQRTLKENERLVKQIEQNEVKTGEVRDDMLQGGATQDSIGARGGGDGESRARRHLTESRDAARRARDRGEQDQERGDGHERIRAENAAAKRGTRPGQDRAEQHHHADGV